MLAEASRLVPYSQEYLSLLSRRGALGAFKKGRNWYISRDDLERNVQSVKDRKRSMQLNPRVPTFKYKNTPSWLS